MFKKIISLFTDHPKWNGESYLKHMAFAFFYSSLFLLAATTCFIHAIFPFLFTKTGSGVARFILGSAEDRGDDI